MTKDVIELAREACGAGAEDPLQDGGMLMLSIGEMQRFAALVAARERALTSNDVERLNFLEAECWGPNPRFHYGSLNVNFDLPDVNGVQSESLRDAIDAAIRALNTEGEGNDTPTKA